MAPSLIYRSARGYELLMRALYGRHYRARLTAVAARVPDRSSVLELCPGPGTLYRDHLRGRVAAYTGADLNPRFVTRLRALGAQAIEMDLASEPELPAADVVIIQASLYHFLPDAAGLVDRMLAAARQRVIIAEPIRNLSCSRVPIIARLGRRGTDPGADGNGHEQRFDEAALDRLMAPYASATAEVFTIPGGREKVYVLAPDPRPGHRSGTTDGP